MKVFFEINELFEEDNKGKHFSSSLESVVLLLDLSTFVLIFFPLMNESFL